MSNIEHYFENLLFDGEDYKGEPNKKELSKEVAEAIETCAAYVKYSLFCGEEDLKDFLGGKGCGNCKFAVKRGRLWGCFNTEVNISSCNSDEFYCSKWERNGKHL